MSFVLSPYVSMVMVGQLLSAFFLYINSSTGDAADSCIHLSVCCLLLMHFCVILVSFGVFFLFDHSKKLIFHFISP